jgi:DNA-binding MarR family transcriptional regulator
MENAKWYEAASIPALLRHARATYGSGMRAALEAAGYDDIPANGLYVIGGLAYGANAPLGDIIRALRISKQAAGQLIDTLVARGYLTRAIDETDRRKLTVLLTERGRAAAEVQAIGCMRIDAELAGQVGHEAIGTLRRTLAALAQMGRRDAAAAE